MDQSERQKLIVEYLRVKPVSHGQVYTFQIAIPTSKVVEVPSERYEIITRSLTEQGTNLMPLIVRRTEDYSEEENYEVVYGAELCLVAKELDIEKLWVWVFDMTDEQAAAAKEQMEQLVGSFGSQELVTSSTSEETQQINSLLQQIIKSLNEKIEILNRKLDRTETLFNNALPNFEQIITVTLERKLKPFEVTIDILSKEVEALRSETKKQEKEGVTTENGEKENYKKMKVSDLKVIAKERNIPKYSTMRKDQLIAALS
jgi:hypothetical protein